MIMGLFTGCTIIIQAPIVCPPGSTLTDGQCLGTVVGKSQPKADTKDSSAETQRLLEIKAKVGSTEWDSAVKAILIGSYDANKNGMIDTPSEVNAVPCVVWEALDLEIKEGEGEEITLMSLYGFPRGYLFNAEALGISESVRDQANDQVSDCGLSI